MNAERCPGSGQMTAPSKFYDTLWVCPVCSKYVKPLANGTAPLHVRPNALPARAAL